MSRQATFAAVVVDEWVRAGVTDAVVCPGSRSTPMALAIVQDGRLRVHVLLDERSAGFFAVGLALASGNPAVVLTTSGTAAVELHPAVVEASQAGVPMIVCTADRPPEKHAVGAPQTVVQDGLFAAAVRWAAPPGTGPDLPPTSWRSVASRTVGEARHGTGGPGPVHLDLAFREPLVEEVDPELMPPGRPDDQPWHAVVEAASGCTEQALAAVDVRVAGRRGVIVAGGGAGDPVAVHRLAEALGWPVLADPRSGCRLPRRATVAAADALLRHPPFAAAARSEVVLRLGTTWASRVVEEWVAGSGADVVTADPHGLWVDPERVAGLVVRAHPTLLCEALADRLPVPAPHEWLDLWRRAERHAQDAFDELLAPGAEDTVVTDPSEPGVARALVEAVPADGVLVASSSMPIRDVEWYGAPREHLRVLSNRGANGIDGVVSTALGVAASGVAPAVVGLVGDLAFLHDVGALWAARNLTDAACVLVVVDNDGGGIFSFLPQARTLRKERFEQLFGTPHGLDVAAIAAAYGLPVTEAETVRELVDAVSDGLTGGGVSVVVVRTDRVTNVAAHAALHDAVAAAAGDVTT